MASNQMLSLIGWSFLPNLVTGWAQTAYYGIMIRAGDPKPQPGSPKYITDRRRIHIIVVSAYLLYTIYEADWEIRRASDFYQDLGLPYSSPDRDIKSRFRRLASKYHPDKVSSSSTNPTAAEGYFVHLKMAQDTLLNPAKRFAYERFGPEVLQWQRCSSVRDYVVQGLQQTLPYYGAATLFMYILGMLGYLEWGRYWRWLTIICLCAFELHTVTRPYFPIVATNILNPLLTTFSSHPPYLPFQLILLARKMSITLYIAFSQIGPFLQARTAVPANATPEAQLKQQIDRLKATAQIADVEASRLIGLEMSPFAGDEQAVRDMKAKTQDWLIQNTIRNDPEVRDAMGNVLKRRRVDAPAGARGNR